MRPVGGRVVRGPPGPAPPRSWLTASIHAPQHLKDKARVAERAAPDRLDRLPGAEIPDKSSLLHQCLKTIARNWKWHVNYDQYYLALMPVKVKGILLSYIAVYGDRESLDINSLRILFLDETELEGATGGEEITHLDLSGAIGQPLTFKQLDQYFAPSTTNTNTNTNTQPPPPTIDQPHPQHQLLESWESLAEPSTTLLSHPLLPTTPFPTLTHLSLSHPNPNANSTSWPRLLTFANSHLATLTHLSLAHWPTPSLTPHATAKSATTSSKYAPSSVSYGCSDYYSTTLDGDWSEAAGVLMRLSRATYCLTWLDLEGCGAWLEALRWEAKQDEGGRGGGGGVEWCGGWRGVETVRVHAGWMPEGLGLLHGDEKTEPGSVVRDKLENGAEKGNDSHMEWDVEDERRKYYARQDLDAWENVQRLARDVQRSVRMKRLMGGGRRIWFESEELRGQE